MADTAAAQTPATPATTAPLDEVMLAMDVVDTLRHADKLVERELASEDRDRQLKERLRQIYAAQGIDVPDRVLDEGVAALRQERFVYTPPPPGFGRTMAMLWIRRGTWGKALLIGLLVLVVGIGGYVFLVEMPQERRAAEQAKELSFVLPQAFANEVVRIKATGADAGVVANAESMATQGAAAAKAGDIAAARHKAAELRALRERLESMYTLRIVSRPGAPSGVFRVPGRNVNARNYYLIVEAVDAQGQPVSVPVTSEEDGKTDTVSTWGLRVSEATFNRVRADKDDDGIIQSNVVGEKRRGRLEPDYRMPVTGGAILAW
jgi:hypothetical protein